MVVGSQITPEKTSYYLKYTGEALSEGPIQKHLVGLMAPPVAFGSLFMPLPFQGH